MHFIINRAVIFLVATLISNTIIGKQWPIKKSDDPSYWDWFNCSFCEIHKTGKPHFHCGIDIDVNKGNCPVRAIESGRIYEIGNSTLGIEIEYPEKSGKYYRRIRYLHLKGKKLKKYKLGDNVNKGDVISVVQDSKAGWSDHLHIEFYQFYENKWMALNPIRNTENWTLDGPDDDYNPEINDIFFEFLPDENNDATGAKIISNSGSMSKRNSYIKIHTKDRPGSVGKVYNPATDIFSVFGNIAPVVFARDAGTNCTVSSGEGLTIYKISYYVNESKKYIIEFDKLDVEDRFEINKIFRTEFNNRKEDQFNGNFDYIKLYDRESGRIAPQKQINGKYSSGIWHTKSHRNSPNNPAIGQISEARSIDEALYPDRYHALHFEAEDASGKSTKETIKVLVDNFVPIVKKVEIYITQGKNKELVYSANQEWNSILGAYQLKVKKNTWPNNLTGDLQIQVKTSEPMSEVILSAKLNLLFTKVNSNPLINSDNTEFQFKIPKKFFSKKITGKVLLEISGKDLANNELFGFGSTGIDGVQQVPSRNKEGRWLPEDYSKTDKSHYILFN